MTRGEGVCRLYPGCLDLLSHLELGKQLEHMPSRSLLSAARINLPSPGKPSLMCYILPRFFRDLFYKQSQVCSHVTGPAKPREIRGRWCLTLARVPVGLSYPIYRPFPVIYLLLASSCSAPLKRRERGIKGLNTLCPLSPLTKSWRGKHHTHDKCRL